MPSHAAAHAADHGSVGPPARAGLPSGPERRALAARMSKGDGGGAPLGTPQGDALWLALRCLPKVADPIPTAFGHAGGWRRSPATAPRTSTGRWPSRRTSCPSAPSSARRPSSSQTRASTSSRSCRRRAALHMHRMGKGMGMGMGMGRGTAPALQIHGMYNVYALHTHCMCTAGRAVRHLQGRASRGLVAAAVERQATQGRDRPDAAHAGRRRGQCAQGGGATVQRRGRQGGGHAADAARAALQQGLRACRSPARRSHPSQLAPRTALPLGRILYPYHAAPARAPSRALT